jgi:hypothetical protein
MWGQVSIIELHVKYNASLFKHRSQPVSQQRFVIPVSMCKVSNNYQKKTTEFLYLLGASFAFSVDSAGKVRSVGLV